MSNPAASDSRLDPRLRAMLAHMPLGEPQGDAKDRDEVIAQMSGEESRAGLEATRAMFDLCDNEDVAPSAGLETSTKQFTSSPDGNTIQIQLIRHADGETRPGVYYIHGGGMAFMSCFDGNYRAWGRIIAAQGVNVAMVDFRNCILPSSAPEVAPFPAGAERLRVGHRVGPRERGRARHRSRPDRRRRRERRRQPDPRDRPATGA